MQQEASTMFRLLHSVDLGGSNAADVTVPCERGAYRYQVDAGKRSVLQQEHRHAQWGSEPEAPHAHKPRDTQTRRSLMSYSAIVYRYLFTEQVSLMPAVTHTEGEGDSVVRRSPVGACERLRGQKDTSERRWRLH